MLAGHEIQLFSGKAHGHQEGVPVGHVVGDHDAGALRFTWFALQSEATVKIAARQCLQQPPDFPMPCIRVHKTTSFCTVIFYYKAPGKNNPLLPEGGLCRG